MDNSKKPRQEYLQKLNTVVEYINSNLDKKISISELAEISNLSQFHFHRIMKGLLGEPIGNFITRTRVETAALLIRYTNLEVQEIANNVGYDKPSSLNKIFRQYYNISPTEYRANNSISVTKHVIKDFSIELEPPRILKISDTQVIYINITGEYGNENYEYAWREIRDFILENELLNSGGESFGISYDDPKITEKENCRYDACVKIDQSVKPKGKIGVKKILGGKFAVFSYQGSYDNWGEVYDIIYDKWLVDSDYELRNVPVMEKYLNGSVQSASKELSLEIYLPIE